MKISSLFKPLSFLPALALMYMIYSFSAQPGETSSSVSYKVSEKIVQAVNVVSGQGWEDWQIADYAARINKYVRKGAHITEYFLLAIAVSFPLYVYGVRGIFLLLLAGLICVAYACGDEYHQSLVNGRAASPRDVGIDSIGILAGVILTRLIGWSGRMAITGPAYERKQKRKQKELDEREEQLRRREEALRREENRRRQMRPDRRSYRNQQADAVRRDSRPNMAQDAARRDVRPNMAQDAARRDVRSNMAQDAARRDVCSNMAQDAARNGARPDNRTAAENRARSDVRMSAESRGHTDDRTRVIGTQHEVDDRTRVYRTEEEQRRMEEAYRRQVYERRKIQSQDLQDDSTSDQLSEDLPFSGLFRSKKK